MLYIKTRRCRSTDIICQQESIENLLGAFADRRRTTLAMVRLALRSPYPSKHSRVESHFKRSPSFS